MTDNSFEIRKPDGTPATAEEIAQAMHAASSATDDTMSCPVTDCSGKVEAQASFWMEIHPDGKPYLAGIGWTEGGSIECSHGGSEHISQELKMRLDPTFFQFCAVAENALGASKGEDRLPKASQRQEAHDARPDDNPEPGDRCKDCGAPITWVGPNHTDWEHI